MARIRVETDLLGSLEVPAEAYYGVHTQRAINNFRISTTRVQDFPEMVRGMVMVKKASALANQELRTLPRDVAEAISAACDLILEVAGAWTSSRLTSSRGVPAPAST